MSCGIIEYAVLVHSSELLYSVFFWNEGKILFLSCVQVYEKGAQTLDKVEKLNRTRLKKLIDDFVQAYAR